MAATKKPGIDNVARSTRNTLSAISRYKPLLELRVKALNIDILSEGAYKPMLPSFKVIELSRVVKSLTIKESTKSEDKGRLSIKFNVENDRFLRREEFRTGVLIEPIIGYQGRLTSYGIWTVQKVSFDFPKSSSPLVSIEANNLKGANTITDNAIYKNWVGKTIREIVTEIAYISKVGVNIQGADGDLDIKSTYVQCNETYSDFIAKIASYTGYFYVVQSNNDIYFGSIEKLEKFPRPLTYHADPNNSSLQSFKVSKIDANKTKNATESGDVDSKTGKIYSNEQSKKDFDKKREDAADPVISNNGTIKQVDGLGPVSEGNLKIGWKRRDSNIPIKDFAAGEASARRRWQLEDFIITATGETILLPELRIAQWIDIKGISKFSGKYLITSLTHKFSSSGYSTTFACTTSNDNLNESTKKPDEKDGKVSILKIEDKNEAGSLALKEGVTAKKLKNMGSE